MEAPPIREENQIRVERVDGSPEAQPAAIQGAGNTNQQVGAAIEVGESAVNAIGAASALAGVNASFNQNSVEAANNSNSHQRHQLTGPGGDRSRSRNKEDITCKRCPTCNIIKTPRVFHCKICDACISVHDHHCPWLGTCVGQRNHPLFVYYGWATKVHSLFAFSLSCYFLSSNTDVPFDPSDKKFLKLYLAQGGMVVYTFCVSILLFALTGYHCCLLLQNSTSQEDLRDKHDQWGGNPYNLGSKHNCWYFMKIQDSLLFTANEGCRTK